MYVYLGFAPLPSPNPVAIWYCPFARKSVPCLDLRTHPRRHRRLAFCLYRTDPAATPGGASSVRQDLEAGGGVRDEAVVQDEGTQVGVGKGEGAAVVGRRRGREG